MREVISLLDISSQDIICILGIHGIGGIGKTMLAKASYNFIVCQFEYASFLSNVRETSNESGGMIRLQNTLMSEMFEEDIKISNVDQGANIIKNRFRDKKILLVLDDVDHKEQLEKLVGECNWFGSGSKIIVTTRNKDLLCASQFEKKYEMRALNADEALELFSWKAFASSQPPVEFVNLSNDVVKYASGLSLALKVIGSNLSGKDLKGCESALKRYKKIPDKDIQRILRISYNGLERTQKEIFLDMACFFKGYYLQDVKNIWRTSELDPDYDIGVLVDKSLITSGAYIGMHDLIQDMGKEVVRDITSKESGKLSRLWIKEEVVKVLKENSGTDQVEGIVLRSPQQVVEWKGTAFKKMKNLRILIVKNACFSIRPKYLPNSLRILIWDEYPSTSLPLNFDPKNIVVWQMTKGSFKLKKSYQDFKFLNVMDFSYCQSITEVPDMSGALALKKLDFTLCENLLKVHDSIGLLTKVRQLYLSFCKNLTNLPSAMKMASLGTLHIEGCTSLEHFPIILEDMDCLSVIYAHDTAIKELPNSTSNLSSLERLIVSGCKNLQEIHGIPSSLQEIDAVDCTSLTLHSHNVLWSQAIKKKKSSDMTIIMPGAQIPDWFDHRCKGRVLSFWARKKLPTATYAFVHNCLDGDILESLFINRVEVQNYSRRSWGQLKDWKGQGRRVYLFDLEDALSEGVEKYLLQEWNYVEVVVMPRSYGSMLNRIRNIYYSESSDCNMFECGIYVDKQGTRMEDVRFECPYITLPMELVLRNALKRGVTFHLENEPPKKLPKKIRNELKREAAFHSENEPPKKLQKKHKSRDDGEKYQNPRTNERKIRPIKKGGQILLQNQHKDFPWEMLWSLHLPPKVIIFLWELCNCILPTHDVLNFGHVQVHQTCSFCGVENETSRHIFMQCTFSRALWFGSHLSIWLDNLDIDVVHLIKSCLLRCMNAEMHKEFTCSMALILYTIWSFRNKAILKGEIPSSKAALKVWFRLYQKYVACHATNRVCKSSHLDSILKSSHFSFPYWLLCWRVYLSVHRVKKLTCKITYCHVFVIEDRWSDVYEGIFLMSGATTKLQVLFQGFKSLFEDPDFQMLHRGRTIYMPSSSCIEMLNEPSMAPAHLQTIVKDVKCLLMPLPGRIKVSCGLFPHSSPDRVKLGNWGSIGKWEWRKFYM